MLAFPIRISALSYSAKHLKIDVSPNRSLESQLFNKSNELQEDISLKRFDLRVAQIHLAAVRAQVRNQ